MTEQTTLSKPLHVGDAQFSTTIKGNPFVVVDTYADWCAPCRMIAPFIEELATEYAGKVTFVKVDVDNSPGVAMQYGIRSIPTILFFKDGELVDQQVGAMPKHALKNRVEELLKS